jgi:hypothetical protein
MSTTWLRASLIAATLGLPLFAAYPSAAQIRPAGRQGQAAARRPAPRNYLPELKAIVDGVATQYGIKIVVEPTLFIAAPPTAPDKALAIDKAMDALVLSAKDLGWRRVYLSTAQGMVVPPAEKLVESVRALDKIEQLGVVLENPATHKATTYLKDWNVTQSFKDDLTSGQFSPTPIYVLYSLKPNGGKLPMDELADMQRRSMEMMMSMDPDQMAQAMDQGVQMFMNMDPDMRNRFMGMQMQAGMKMFQNMSPEQRNQLMQSVMQSFPQGGFGAPGGAPPGGGRP